MTLVLNISSHLETISLAFPSDSSFGGKLCLPPYLPCCESLNDMNRRQAPCVWRRGREIKR